MSDLLFFVGFLGAAIYYRKNPVEHKALMLMTAINFLPPALGRLSPVPPQYAILWWVGIPSLIAIGCLLWNWKRHGKLNRVFTIAVLLLVLGYPVRIYVAGTQVWHDAVAAIAPKSNV